MKRVISFANPPSVVGYSSVVGKREHDGPIGEDFDIHDRCEKFGMNTWEKAESEMQRLAVNLALAKSDGKPDDIDMTFAGDLQNQCVGSAFGAGGMGRGFFGLYGACSTFAEAIILASLSICGGFADTCAAVASSHFCVAERQYRYPLEYGGQRTPTSQRTVTGAGAMILSSGKGNIKITEVMAGRIVNKGIKDANNMGAAMAPAAVDTIKGYLTETGHKPDDFDLILTGDLGAVGHGAVLEYLGRDGIDVSKNYSDCGLMIYSCGRQDMHAGGSGCGCSAATVCGHIMKRFEKGELSDILYIATGALMSTSSVQQGLAIPGIAHLVRIRSEGKNGD